MESLVLNEGLSYSFNPFGGLHDEELVEALVPRPFTQQIITEIKKGDKRVIELLGKRGRGKTSHLRFLYQQFESYPLFSPQNQIEFKEILAHPSPILFLDSIHKLRLAQRIHLFKAKQTVILTTHWSRKMEYTFAQAPSISYKFQGSNHEILQKIISKRIAIATGVDKEAIRLHTLTVQKLSRQYGDNYRGILNHLFDQFTNSYAKQTEPPV